MKDAATACLKMLIASQKPPLPTPQEQTRQERKPMKSIAAEVDRLLLE
jgi:hypothetical protein